MAAYDENIFIELKKIIYKNLNCVNDLNEIKSICSQSIMTKGTDLYGLFYPEPELSKYFVYNGKITTKENKKNFKYYFDDQSKLRLTERYDDHGSIMNYIFYYYSENLIEIVWYCVQRSSVCLVGFIEYNNNEIVKFIESYDIVRNIKYNRNLKSYHEYNFEKDKNYILKRVYSEEILNNGKVWETISKIKKI